MNTKRVLVYGDSIPWGMIPATRFERYPFDKRWPGVLQNKLGENYQVIEECLCARTINTDDQRPGFEGRNGMKYITPCLDSHYPLDIIIISLGLNEIKSFFPGTPKEAVASLGEMIKLIRERKPNFFEWNPRILLMSQPIVESTGFWGENWIGSHEKSIDLREGLKQLAKEMNVEFVDIDIEPEEKDGVHIDEKEHSKIADAVSKIIKGE